MEKDQRHLSAKISKFYREFVSGKQKIFFSIDIEFIYNKWSVNKRYSDFETLQKSLKQTFPHLPSLPGKSFFTLKKDADIEKRRVKLETYIKELVQRSDIYSDSQFINFFEVSIILKIISDWLVGGTPARYYY